MFNLTPLEKELTVARLRLHLQTDRKFQAMPKHARIQTQQPRRASQTRRNLGKSHQVQLIRIIGLWYRRANNESPAQAAALFEPHSPAVLTDT